MEFKDLTTVKSDEYKINLEVSIDGKNFKDCSSDYCVGKVFKSNVEQKKLEEILNTKSYNSKITEYVNIFMGTNNEGAKFSRGNQHPGVHVPFGMNAFSVTTKDPTNPWFYQYDEKHITGIKLTHQPSVWARDHAAMTIFPGTKIGVKNFLANKQPYEKKNEIAFAHYYKNSFNKSGLSIEFTPTNRGVHYRFGYNKGSNKVLNISAKDNQNTKVAKSGESSFEGSIKNKGLKLYFYAEASAPVKEVLHFPKNTQVVFADKSSESIELKFATSYISIEQAKSNFEMELMNHSFDSSLKNAENTWEKTLSNMKVEGSSVEDRITFYSSLYRVHAFPKTFWEHVGTDKSKSHYFSPYDNKVHEGKLWSGNGFWDTYRAVWPLFTVLYPKMTGEMLNGWLRSYKDGGWMVRWSNPGYWQCMISTHSDIIFADAMIKGIDFDHELAFEASLKNAMVANGYQGKGRRFLEHYNFNGFIPWYNKNTDDEVGARTIEHAYNDFGLYLMAKNFNKDKLAAYFKNRAHSYQNLWSRSKRHFRAKKLDGSYRTSNEKYNPYAWRYAWTEGNAWHYRTPAPYDTNAMSKLFGSRIDLEKIIDEVLSASSDFDFGGYGREIHEMTEAKAIGEKGFGQFAIGNQPIQHMLHMYNYTPSPHKAQYWVKRSLRELFNSGFHNGHGYPGDEDNGQTSAWYVMNAIGFYSASPGISEYALTSGIFDTATIRLENGKNFVFKSENNNLDFSYVAEASLNGNDYNKNFITHEDLTKGGELLFSLQKNPSDWSSLKTEQGSSMSSDSDISIYRHDLLKDAYIDSNCTGLKKQPMTTRTLVLAAMISCNLTLI